MKFYNLQDPGAGSKNPDREQDYRSAREIGIVRLGTDCLYFRRLRKIYFIPYADIHRCFRRVMLVPAKLCCGRGDLEVEHLVICTDQGEAAQLQLPGAKAGKLLLEELKQRAPGAAFTPKPQE